MRLITQIVITILVLEKVVNQNYRDRSHHRYVPARYRSTNSPPQSLRENNREWIRRIVLGYLVNMTDELVKDATYKTNHARRLRDNYHHSQPFQLGHVTASVRDKFETMLETYWYFQNPKKLADGKFNIQWMSTHGHFDYYLFIQGLHHEIEMEIVILNEIARRKELGLDPLAHLTTEEPEALRSGVKGKAPKEKSSKKPLWQPNQKEKKAPEDVKDLDYKYY